MSINRVVVTGRLTADPELRRTTAGVEVTTVSIAVDRTYKNADGQREADFINVVAWRNTAIFLCSYCHKGDKLAVDGKFQTRKWKDKYDQNRVTIEIIADNIDLCSKKQGDNEPEYDATSVQTSEFTEYDDDDVPPF